MYDKLKKTPHYKIHMKKTVSPATRATTSGGGSLTITPGTLTPEEVNRTEERPLDFNTVNDALIEGTWNHSYFKTKVDLIVRMGKVTGSVLNVILIVWFVRKIGRYFSKVAELNIRDRYGLVRLKEFANAKDIDVAIEKLLSVEKSVAMLQEKKRNFVIKGVDADTIAAEYALTMGKAEEFLMTVLSDNQNDPEGNIYSIPKIEYYLDKIRNDNLTDTELARIRHNQLINARFASVGLFESNKLNMEVAKDAVKLNNELFQELDNMKNTIGIVKKALFQSQEAQQTLREIGERLGVKLDIEVFMNKALNALKKRIPSGHLGSMAVFMLNQHGLQMISSVVSSMTAMIEHHIDRMVLETGVNNTDINEDRRIQMVADILATTGYVISTGNVLTMAGLAMATNSLHLATITSIISLFALVIEDRAFGRLRRQLHKLRKDSNMQLIPESEEGYPTFRDQYKNQSYFWRHVEHFTLATIGQLARGVRLPLSYAAIYPTCAGACLIAAGFATTYVEATLDVSHFKFDVSTALNAANLRDVTKIVPAVAGFALFSYHVIMDVWTEETVEYQVSYAGVVGQFFQRSADFIARNSTYLHLAAGIAGAILYSENIPLSPTAYAWECLSNVTNFTTFTNFLGKKNEMDVFYWKMKQPKEWETKRPPLLLRLRYK